MPRKRVVMPDSTITQEMIEGMRAKLGLKLRVEESTHNEYATRMAILVAYSLCVLSSTLNLRPSLARIPSIISWVIVESGITTLFLGIIHLFDAILLRYSSS